MEMNWHKATSRPPNLSRFRQYFDESFELPRRLERLYKLFMPFEVADYLTPCVVWIPTLNAYTSQWYVNFIMRGLPQKLMNRVLKLVRGNRSYAQRMTLVLGGCDNPRYLDPGYVHPDLFSEMLRIDLFTQQEREDTMSTLLTTYGLTLASNLDWTTMHNATMGFTMRDLTSLSEHLYRMCSLLGSSEINEGLIGEALDRKTMATDLTDNAHTNYSYSIEHVTYHLGRGIIRSRTRPQRVFFEFRQEILAHVAYVSQWILDSEALVGTVTSGVILSYFSLLWLAWQHAMHGRLWLVMLLRNHRNLSVPTSTMQPWPYTCLRRTSANLLVYASGIKLVLDLRI